MRVRLSAMFALALGAAAFAQGGAGTIAGRVTDATTLAPIEGAVACAFEGEAGPGGCAPTNSNGEYVISGLPSGSEYKVEFDAFGPSPELRQRRPRR